MLDGNIKERLNSLAIKYIENKRFANINDFKIFSQGYRKDADKLKMLVIPLPTDYSAGL